MEGEKSAGNETINGGGENEELLHLPLPATLLCSKTQHPEFLIMLLTSLALSLVPRPTFYLIARW